MTSDTVTNDATAGVSWLSAGCRGGFYILQDGHVPGSERRGAGDGAVEIFSSISSFTLIICGSCDVK